MKSVVGQTARGIIGEAIEGHYSLEATSIELLSCAEEPGGWIDTGRDKFATYRTLDSALAALFTDRECIREGYSPLSLTEAGLPVMLLQTKYGRWAVRWGHDAEAAGLVPVAATRLPWGVWRTSFRAA